MNDDPYQTGYCAAWDCYKPQESPYAPGGVYACPNSQTAFLRGYRDARSEMRRGDGDQGS